MARMNTISLEGIGQKVMAFGPPKSGKTQLAGTLAKHFNTYWFDLEHGYLTLKKFPEEVQANIELIRIPDNRQNHQAIKSMLLLTDGKPVKICDLHGQVGPKCSDCAMSRISGNTKNIGNLIDIDISQCGPNDLIVVDSLTQLSHSAMGKAFGGQTEDKVKPEYSHYMAQGFYLDKFLTFVQQSQANWLVISHEESLFLEDGSEKVLPMAGTRNFSRNSARYFDHVVYCSIKNYKHNTNSIGTTDMKVLSGSRTDVDLNSKLTEGLITMFRTVKGTLENEVAKSELAAIAGPQVADKEKSGVAVKPPVSAATQAILDRLKKPT